jgi:hypothetical protein
MIHRYIIEATDDVKGFEDAIEKLDREWGIEEQEPCEDAISRQAVLDILKDKWNMFSDANDAMQESIDTIETISPVTPQPKTGRWIDDCGGVKCSCCGYSIDDCFYAKTYCTNCGAKMESEVEECH